MTPWPSRPLTAQGRSDRLWLWAVAVVVALTSITARPQLSAGLLPAGEQRTAAAGPSRIVSLVPAASEFLFEIGAGPRVVGIGSYDHVPDAFRRLPRVGGLLDPDVERILSLKPDLVVVYATQEPLIERLSRASIPMFRYQHRDLADVTDTMRQIGTRIGLVSAAADAASAIEQRLANVRAAVSGRTRPKTLLVFGREAGTLRQIHASGGFGFLHDLLETAGGLDVMADIKRESVEMSTEMVLARAPAVIIELRYGRSAEVEREQDQQRAWSLLPSLPAVRTGRIHLLIGDEFVVPGPRVALVAERFARVLHPGALP